jgi:hypothetical protein
MTLPHRRGPASVDPRGLYPSAWQVATPALRPIEAGNRDSIPSEWWRRYTATILTPRLRIPIPAAQLRQCRLIPAPLTMRNKYSLAILGASTALVVSGCATLISGRHADVAIQSNPSDAHVTVRDRRGMPVAEATTPAVIPLKRGDGFFRKARYTATIEKPGYESAQVAIDAKLNPWVAGNLVFGGVAGMVVDPYTGAMWKPKPNEIQLDLAPLSRSEVAQATHVAPAIDPAAPERIR